MSSKKQTPAMFMIYKNTTLIILQQPTAIAVEITNSFQAYFDEFWNSA